MSSFLKPLLLNLCGSNDVKKFFTWMMIFMCVMFIYISPVNSSYSSQRDDIFDLLEHNIANFSKLGKCVLLGDFNARTSLEADFIVHDSDTFVDVNCDYVIDEPLLRRNVVMANPSCSYVSVVDCEL